MTTRIRRHSDAPFPVDLPDLGLTAIANGDVIEVDTDIAGRPPFWRRLADGERQVPWLEYRQHAGRTEVHDLGTGLLAQLGNWEPVDATLPESSVAESRGAA